MAASETRPPSKMLKFCKVLMYIILTFFALLGISFALCVAYVTAVVFLPTYFPTPIHKFSRTWDIESALDLNNPNVKLSPWGLPYDSECGKIRMIILDMDCLEPAKKCQEKIEDFEAEYGKIERREREERFANISRYCFEAANCMRDMACKEATYKLNEFHKHPHNFFLNYSSLPKCITDFYRAVRRDSFDNCTSSYQFLSKDPFIKNHAYYHGKFCFLSFSSQHCQPEIVEYLENYYDFFLELAMIPSLEDCGVFEKFEALECHESMETFEKSVEFLKASNQTQKDYAEVGTICGKMQNCLGNLTNSCAIPTQLQVKTKEYCEKMHFFASPFWQCVQRLKHENIQPDVLRFPCFIGHQFNDDSKSCQQFTELATCTRGIMVSHCGTDVLDEFENSRKYLLNMWDC